MIAEIALGPLLPDQPDYKNPGVIVADGCYPSPGGYSPFRGPIGTGETVSGDIRGVRRFERADGSIVTVVGTSSDLTVIIGGVQTASGLAYSLTPDTFWSFEQINSQVWAFAFGQVPVYLPDINSDTAFVAHPGVAPLAGSCGRVSDFIVTGNMVDIDASTQPYRVRWSQFNNPAGDYGTDIATQSGYVDMPSALGPVVGIFGTRSDVILQKYGVSRLTYTGGATAFRIDTIEDQRGCAAQASVVIVGGLVYFLSNDGFCRTDGTSVDVVSERKVFEWFQENVEASEVNKTQGVVNWQRRCIIWSFVPASGSTRSRQIIYSWQEDRWSTASLDNSWLFATTEEGLTLEQYAAIYTNIDTAPVSLDSPEFRAKDRTLAGVIDGELVNMTGDSLAAEWETGDFQPQAGSRACTYAIYPLVENRDENTTIAIGARETYKGQTVVWSADMPVDVGGFCPVIKDGRYLRARMRIPAAANWDKATGMQVEFNVTGRL